MPPLRTIVLDTAALLAGLGPHAASGAPARWVVPVRVRDEVRPGGPTGRAVEQALQAGLEVVAVPAAARAAVDEAARRHGETARLSPGDLDVLAVALAALGAGPVELWTDDYGVQNLARVLDIPTRPVMTSGIRATATWHVRCTGCGRYPPEGEAVASKPCAICGSALKRTRRPPPRRDRPTGRPEGPGET